MKGEEPNGNSPLDPQAIKRALDANVSEKQKNLGDFYQPGRYTLFFVVAYEFFLLPQMLLMTFSIYSGLLPRVVACGDRDLRNVSSTEACSLLPALQQSTGCVPVLEAEFHSLGFEFGYYCGSISHVKTSISIQMTGVLIGAMIFGQLSDAWGRKRMMLFAYVGMGVFSFLASRASSLLEFTIIQIFTMIAVGGQNTIMHVFLVENLPKSLRVVVNCLVSYSPQFILQSILAFYAGDWRNLLRISSFFTIPAFCFLLITFESPRWMIQKAYLESAREVLQKIERINRTATPERLREIDEIIEQEVIQNEEKKRKRKQYYFYHLFCNWSLCKYVAVISYSLFVTSFVSYSLLFNMSKIPGSIFVSTALFGVFRWSLNLVVGGADFFIQRAGRKTIYSFALSFILLMLATSAVCKIVVDIDCSTVLRVATLSAAAMCSQLYIVNGIVTSELFPTAIRNLAVSFVQIFNRLGAVAAPHLFALSTLYDPLPFVVLFVLMAVSQAVFLSLPETKGCSMLDHMPEKNVRVFRRNRRESMMTAHIPPSSARLTEDI